MGNEENNCIITHLNKNDLEKLHTKQLLKKLRGHNICLSTYCYEYCKNSSICSKIKDENVALLRDVLKNRPHVPNKKESKELRKARIKKGK